MWSAEAADIIISLIACGQLKPIGCSDDGQTFAKKRDEKEAKEVWIQFYKHKQDALWWSNPEKYKAAITALYVLGISVKD